MEMPVSSDTLVYRLHAGLPTTRWFTDYTPLHLTGPCSEQTLFPAVVTWAGQEAGQRAAPTYQRRQDVGEIIGNIALINSGF